ncbi:MAG: lipopolysaccharide heptosyltransferase II [SAR324 cluster bacterium]|nr:lipopolysaccharide heptosyltransferase II [SAR324 cluster bacterium]
MEAKLNDTPLKICVRCPNWLGDLFMSTAFITRLMELHPHAQIDLIVKKGFENLPLPHRGKIIPFTKKAFNAIAFGLSLRHKKYDLFYVLPPSPSAAVMAYFSGATTRIGLIGTGRMLWLNEPVDYDREPRSQHLIDEFSLLFKETTEPTYPSLPLAEGWATEQLQGLKLPEKFIALAPGAIYGPAKEWPLTHWQELANLLSKTGFTPLIIGQEGDFDLDLPKEAVNFCGKTNLNQLIALLSKASLLVSNDSGAMHVMSALKKNQIAIFGSTSTVWTGPRNTSAEVVTVNLDCAPCFQRTCKFGHYDCLTQITAESIFGKIQSFKL